MGDVQSRCNEQLPLRDFSDWKKIQVLGKCSYIHKISGDQFELFQTLDNQALAKAVKERSTFSFEFTPRLIIHSIKNHTISFLVQQSIFSVISILQNNKFNTVTVLILLKDILKTLELLKNKYGCFYPKDSMIRAGKNYNLLIWINQKFHLNQREFPLPQTEGEYIMVDRVNKLFSRYLHPSKLPINASLIKQAISKINYFIQNQSNVYKHNIQNSFIETQPPIFQHYYPKKFNSTFIQQTPFKNRIQIRNNPLKKYQSRSYFKNQQNDMIETKYQYLVNKTILNKKSQNEKSLISLNYSPQSSKIKNQDKKTNQPKSFLVLYDCSPVQQHNPTNPQSQSNHQNKSKNIKKNITNKISQTNSQRKQRKQSVSSEEVANLNLHKSNKNIKSIVSQSQEVGSPLRRKIKNQLDQLFTQ